MKTEDFFQREDCRICKSSALEKVVELTPTPPGNNFLSKDQIGTKEKEYPLELHFCNNCCHVQLGHVVDSSLLFQNSYSYVSGTSPVFVSHLNEYAEYIIDLFDLENKEDIIFPDDFNPLIKDSINSNIKKNAFVFSNSIFQSYYIGDIEIEEQNFKCFKPSAGKITFTIEGTGNKALINS